jgi:hypothetical protein
LNIHDDDQKGDLDLTASRQEDPYLAKLENDRKLAAWEAQQKERKEQKEREEKRAALQAYLRTRAQEWADTTGEQPGPDERRRWQREYLDGLVAERERERASSLREAYREFPWSPS